MVLKNVQSRECCSRPARNVDTEKESVVCVVGLVLYGCADTYM